MPDLEKHYGLCEYVAEKFHKSLRGDVTLWEYNSFATTEFPDVLVYRASVTTLFEIKMTRSNFKQDAKKESRSKYKVTNWVSFNRMPDPYKKIIFKDPRMKEFIVEAPHLGLNRYYVCPDGLIQPEEVGHWGLYWLKGKRFYLKKKSKVFRRNIYGEQALLCNALRKVSSGYHDQIITKPYYKT